MVSDSDAELARRVLDAALGVVVGAAAGGVRLGYWLVGGLPVVGPALRQGVDSMSHQGARVLAERVDPGLRDIRALIMQAVSSVLEDIDLTALIRDRIDLDLLIESIDMDAVVARLDVAAVVDGLDIDAVVEQLFLDAVVERLDVGAVVRRLDIDAVVARLDLDAVVAELDIDSIVRRIDLVAVMAGMVERVNLPALRRSSNRIGAAAADSDPLGQAKQTAPKAAGAVERLRDQVTRGRSVEKRRR